MEPQPSTSQNRIPQGSPLRRPESLKEMKKRLKSQQNRGQQSNIDIVVENVYAKVEKSKDIVRKRTGITMDNKMILHKCEWDRNYPESPDRYIQTVNRCILLGLVDKCEILDHKPISLDDVQKVHKEWMYTQLQEMHGLSNEEKEEQASKYDAVYFNEHTFDSACIAAGCVLSVVDNVCKGVVQNGMAFVRPPGHHAMADNYCGYCFFNNVAIGAKHALDNKLAEKILIVDFDVHHGQGTQRMFYEDKRVLYFSIHRYEHGNFWPNLRESNFDYIGGGDALGYNINVPLNAIGLNDVDYLSIILHILLPVAYEYNPDLIMFSAGYDACLGCPEGQMNITPGFYCHLMTLLGGLADGKLVACLEGGYFLPSLADGAAMTLKGLLDLSPPILTINNEINDCIIDVINNLKLVLHPYWKCFQVLKVYEDSIGLDNIHEFTVNFADIQITPPYPTRDCYAVKDSEEVYRDKRRIYLLRRQYGNVQARGVCYAYDAVMLDHESSTPHPECPLRLIRIYEMFRDYELDIRCSRIPGRIAEADVLRMIHDSAYISSLSSLSYQTGQGDIFYNEESLRAIFTAAGSLLSIADAIMAGTYRSGVGLIRPPGHHAEHDQAHGFCFIANVAVCAKYLNNYYNIKRILILDFDIHHGNGTQRAFYQESYVLYISVHKYMNGNFFPNSAEANYDKVGLLGGLGFNVNIPFNEGKMGDAEYMAVFYRVILPIAYTYSPEIVIVSAGFDAGVFDTLGDYHVTPEAFGHFIQLIKSLANGKLILALEGGYNVNTIAYSMTICVKALLGDPMPRLEYPICSQSAAHTIENVIDVQKNFCPMLAIDKRLIALPDTTTLPVTIGNT